MAFILSGYNSDRGYYKIKPSKVDGSNGYMIITVIGRSDIIYNKLIEPFDYLKVSKIFEYIGFILLNDLVEEII